MESFNPIRCWQRPAQTQGVPSCTAARCPAAGCPKRQAQSVGQHCTRPARRHTVQTQTEQGRKPPSAHHRVHICQSCWRHRVSASVVRVKLPGLDHHLSEWLKGVALGFLVAAGGYCLVPHICSRGTSRADKQGCTSKFIRATMPALRRWWTTCSAWARGMLYIQKQLRAGPLGALNSITR